MENISFQNFDWYGIELRNEIRKNWSLSVKKQVISKIIYFLLCFLFVFSRFPHIATVEFLLIFTPWYFIFLDILTVLFIKLHFLFVLILAHKKAVLVYRSILINRVA